MKKAWYSSNKCLWENEGLKSLQGESIQLVSDQELFAMVRWRDGTPQKWTTRVQITSISVTVSPSHLTIIEVMGSTAVAQ